VASYFGQRLPINHFFAQQTICPPIASKPYSRDDMAHVLPPIGDHLIHVTIDAGQRLLGSINELAG
jgi:hypothetical protein